MTAGDDDSALRTAAALPAGSRDVLSAEAEDLRAIERALRERFAAWGYREVITPVLEFASVMDRAQEGGLADAFRLFDESGRVLVLRPDLTIPVARLIAGRLAEHPGPVRVYYVQTAFRPPAAGRAEPAELRQAGVELVGAAGPSADAEAIALLAESLAVAGAPGARIAVGDVWLVSAILEDAGVPEAARARMRAAVAGRDLVAWRAQARALGLPAESTAFLEDVPRIRGGAEVLDRIARAAPAAAGECDRLRQTLDLVERHDVGSAVQIDLGVLRDRPYYSGIVVEAFVPGVGAPVAAGGRYDGLAERFGRARPAVGFAIALDDLHRAVAARPAEGAATTHGVVLVGGMDADLAAAREARAAGVPVVSIEADDAGGEDLARADGRRFVARRGEEGFEVLDTISGERVTRTSLTEGIPSTA
jgi:ATP phosphoribosyltransferase regulatory subunit